LIAILFRRDKNHASNYTFTGGLLVIFFGAPSATKLGVMLSASCGVMLYISFMDLLPEAQEEIGYVMANFWVNIAVNILINFRMTN
jgi:zinc transporter ZupT